MIRGLYAAATALEAATQNQNVVAHNLAHATTPGYRAKGLVYESFDRVLGRTNVPTGDIVGVRVAEEYRDFKTGGLQSTGSPLDFAIENDGFFVLAGPDGPVFTRNGTFHLTAGGGLVSQGGYPVQGTIGAVTIPPGAATVDVGQDGTITADGSVVGRIQLARFTSPQKLEEIGPTLFRAPTEAGRQTVEAGVLQGFRESSNVSPAEAMVQLISGSRYFEASQRVLRAISDAIQLNTRPT